MKKVLVIVAMMLLGSSGAWADGADTNYATQIKNGVTLSYTVGGNDQTDLSADDGDGFIVDRKVDVEVATTDLTNVIVHPGDNTATDASNTNNKYLTFTVTNQTNGDQGFKLSLENLADNTATLDSGEKDNIDFASGLKVCAENDCANGDISGTHIDFTEDETKTYYVFAEIPVGTEKDKWASIALIATAVEDGATNTTTMTDDSGVADNANGNGGASDAQVVFAEEAGVATGDTQYHGEHSALSAFEVRAADLTATKSSCVVTDNITTDDTKAKRIPGATIRYYIHVDNTNGSADAENVTTTDTLKDQLTYVRSGIEPGACDCANWDGTSDAGTTSYDDDGNAATKDVTLNFGTIAAGTDECAYIDATID